MLKEEDIHRIATLFLENVYEIKHLDGYHNHIVEVIGDKTIILRISEQKNTESTQSEIDFLRYLSKHNAPISAPIISLENKYVHCVVINDYHYVVSAFKKVNGKDFKSRGFDGNERFKIIGKALGKIHQLSKLYTPSTERLRRNWDESPHILKAPSIFKAYNPDLLDSFNAFLTSMHSFNKNPDNFGLIHGDFLFSNYFFDDNNNISVFDFDECEYSWYVYDIAVCMYYYLLGGDPKELIDKSNEAKEMFYHLVLGYICECELDINCVKNMNSFFTLREYVLLSSVLEKSNNDLRGWKHDFVEGAVDRLLMKKVFIDVDFEKVYSDALKEIFLTK